MIRAIFLFVVWFSLAIGRPAWAESEAFDGQAYDIDIPALNAAEALNRLAEQTGAIMLFPYDLAEARQANAVLGRYTLEDALSEMLRDSGLSSGLSDKRVIQIALDEPVIRNKGEKEVATEKVSRKKTIGTFVASLFIATGASAQQSAATAEEEAVVDEIVITGSRLQRDSFNVSTPLVTIDGDAIADTGLGSLAEILVDEIPAIYESTSNLNSQSSVSQTGLSSINLRRLGSERTLTLIDGRRSVANNYNGNSISLSTIPASMIERVEVVTGGSSAAYGSDAAAGVINIITQQDKKGFGIEVRTGATSEGGGEELEVTTDFGTSYANERGYLFMSATYDRQYGIDWADRSRGSIQANYNYNDELLCNEMATATYDPVRENYNQCMRDITPADWRDRSDGIAGGVFEEGSDGVGGYWYNEDGLQTDWLEERDGLFSRIWDVVKIPNETTAVALKTDYELTDDTKMYFQVQYSRDTAFNFKSPEDDAENSDVAFIDRVTGLPGEVRPGTIATDNPFAPAEIADNAGSSISWDRRFFEVGNITTDNTRTTLRTWAGLQGGLFDNEWDWDVSVGYGKFTQKQIRSNELDVFKVSQALDAEFAPDGVTIQCADPDARAAGCVPLNIFGVGSITPEMADWIRVNPVIDTDLSQVNVLGYITGDLFDMPAGPVGVVLGGEFRRDKVDLNVSGGYQFGGITTNLVPAFTGDIDVAEVFGEVAFPLAERLSAEFSVRVGDYSPDGISTIFSHSSGLIWEPIDGYNIRANFARAQRAPTITELLSPPRGDFDSYDDICDEVTLTSTDAGHDNCRLDPGIAATIAADGEFEDDNNSYSPNAGNPDLFEETADTYTVGVSIAPAFLDGFRFAIDYYDITISDAIDSFGNEDIVEQCYNSSITLGDPNRFCDDITRDDEGQIIEVLQRVFNLNETSTSGFDVTMEYVFELNGFGDLEVEGNYTHIDKHETISQGIDGLIVEDFNNQLDFGIFEDAAKVSMTWRHDDWRIRWRTTYLGPIVDSQSRVDEYLEVFAENDALCAAADPDCITNPEIPDFLFYSSYTKHDLSAAYTMELQSGASIRLSGGIRNLFDNKGPFIPRTGDNDENGIGNFDSKYGGGVGRFYFLGAELRFDD